MLALNSSLTPAYTQARAELLAFEAQGLLVAGKMATSSVCHEAWRQDGTAWLTAEVGPSLPLLAALNAQLHTCGLAMGAVLRKQGQMDLSSVHDMQLALFRGGGACFKAHSDTIDLQGPGRKLTLVLYLQPPEWTSGGALRVQGVGPGGSATDIPPLGGTLVVMRSDLVHAVQPCWAPRAALTVWFDGHLMTAHALYKEPIRPAGVDMAPASVSESRAWSWLPCCLEPGVL